MDFYDFNDDFIRQHVLHFMRSHNIEPDDNENIFLDGILHRYKTREDKQGETSGAYCIFTEGWPAGWVQDWRKGEAITWCLERKNLDEAGHSFFDDERYKKAVELSKKHQAELLAQREMEQALASEKARITFEGINSYPDIRFPYLHNKRVLSYGLKLANNLLLVPLRNINGQVKSLQYISPEGDKKYFPGAQKKGAFFSIALDLITHNHALPILVAEGYATAATIYELTELPTVAAMDCGNLLPVCEALKAKFPKSKIIICADNDHLTENNPGLQAANSVCKQLNLTGVLYPDFQNDNNGTDWNDYYIFHGEDNTRNILQDKITFVCLSPRMQNVLNRVEQFNAEQLRNAVFPPLKWAVEGFLPAGCTILGGNPKVGKSILALHIALAVAIGGCVLGKIFVQQGDVLYLSLEDTKRRLQERINGSDLPEDCNLSRLTVAPVVPRQHEGGMEYIEWWLQNHKHARLVIIDTLQKFRKQLSGKTNIYSEDYDVVSEIKSIADKYDVAFLVIHHLKKGKDNEDWTGEFSGSQGIMGAADTLFSLKRARADKCAILRRTGRDVEEKDFALRLDGYGWVLEGDATLFTMPEWKRQILNYMKTHETVTPMELAEVLNLKINTARQNLSRLFKDGDIKKIGYGTYSIL